MTNYLKALALMAHCREVEDDAEAPLTRQTFPKGEGVLIVPMPHEQFEVALHPVVYPRVMIGS